MFNRKGFTLVELMIVVAIIGILAAIAIPNFVSMQYKTKRSEVPTNLRNIKTAEVEYEQNYDVYIKCSAYPSTPTKTDKPTPKCPTNPRTGAAPCGRRWASLEHVRRRKTSQQKTEKTLVTGRRNTSQKKVTSYWGSDVSVGLTWAPGAWT